MEKTKKKGKKIVCSVRFETKSNEDGKPCPAVVVTCPSCKKEEMSWGNGSTSIKRSCVVLAKNCGCGNFLVCDERTDAIAVPSIPKRSPLKELFPSNSVETDERTLNSVLNFTAQIRRSCDEIFKLLSTIAKERR